MSASSANPRHDHSADRLRQLSNQINMSSHGSQTAFSAVQQAPEDPLFGLMAAYRADKDPKKVDLGIGAYRDNNAVPWVLPVVKKVRAHFLNRSRGLQHTDFCLDRLMPSSTRTLISTTNTFPSPVSPISPRLHRNSSSAPTRLPSRTSASLPFRPSPALVPTTSVVSSSPSSTTLQTPRARPSTSARLHGRITTRSSTMCTSRSSHTHTSARTPRVSTSMA